jgi:hypothetical protein
MPMYEKKVKITGSAKSKPAAKKPTMPAKPSANMAKMNKSAATGKPKPKPKAKLKPKSKMGMM